ncbi:PREDICTED: complex I assembly factor TIMMDC1, mitochondrial isoform X2 [Bison bison bison]|uniref:Complex I assembly factor TIMMDC1, mitochondrial n=1 Tax=Bison bison bison TaxID=43346 RepID=A0A6P3HLW1_BISBB|nr:PREDICTED: complex I assembly factor TIMMDC1, mitochondrial isoform X2 [Bison bison bison]
MEARPPAPRSFLCRSLRPFPRVFAAAAVAADPKALVEDQELSSFVSEPQYPESGWDRLRELFVKDERQRTSKELQDIYKAAISAGIIGWAYGGIPAFIHAKQRYIEQSQAEVYHNQLDAVQSAHRAATRGFIRYGWRWSWRTAMFVTIFNTPIGSLLMALQMYCGETVQERKQKDRKAFQELKVEERKARLQFTELLPEEIESNLQKDQSEDDAQKIEALLNLPRNPSSTDKQDKD